MIHCVDQALWKSTWLKGGGAVIELQSESVTSVDLPIYMTNSYQTMPSFLKVYMRPAWL